MRVNAMSVVTPLLLIGIWFAVTTAASFVQVNKGRRMRKHRFNTNFARKVRNQSSHLFDFMGGFSPRIPKSSNERNQQIVKAVLAAMKSPRTPSFRLLECEFPALSSLNKQGDGSLRSSAEVEDANLVTAKQLRQALSPIIPGLGPAVWLVTSSGASIAFQRKAASIGGAYVHSLREGLPALKSRDVCIVIAPCNSQDYILAQRIVANGNTVVLLNGLAKDPKSIPGDATMAYYLKPLTYNSNIAGYLIRMFPGQWTVVDGIIGSAKVLGTFLDKEILVSGTNTPDLRAPGRLVQKSVDDRAIRSRQEIFTSR